MSTRSFYVYWQFDLAEAIDVGVLRRQLAAAGCARSPQFRAEFQASFDYGVLRIELACPFDLAWLGGILGGEDLPLSASEPAEILRSVMSYCPTDLLVVGWMAAAVYDNDEGAAATRELLEYVNTQLQ